MPSFKKIKIELSQYSMSKSILKSVYITNSEARLMNQNVYNRKHFNITINQFSLAAKYITQSFNRIMRV